jgi:photosystem II stability/assembly factor-like uncharacterized protein
VKNPFCCFIGLHLLLFSLTISCSNQSTTGLLFDRTGWQKLKEENESHSPAITSLYFFDERNGIATLFSRLDATDDGGKTWRTLKQDDSAVFGPIVRGSANDIWVLHKRKDNASVLHTDDRGVSWQEIPFDTGSRKLVEEKLGTAIDVCSTGENGFWLAGTNGVMKLRYEANQLHLTGFSDEVRNIVSISCGGNNVLWAVNENHAVMKYEKEWMEIPIDSKFVPLRIKVVGNSVWVLGRRFEDQIHGMLLEGTNNGETWEVRPLDSRSTPLDIYIDNNEGWLVGTHGSIFRSSNGGKTWNRVDSQTTNDLDAIFFAGPGLGWIGGDRFTVLSLSSR